MREGYVEKNRHRCLRDLLVGMALFRSDSLHDYHWARLGCCRSETASLGREHEGARCAVLEVSCLAVHGASLHHPSGRIFSPRSSTTRTIQLVGAWQPQNGEISIRRFSTMLRRLLLGCAQRAFRSPARNLKKLVKPTQLVQIIRTRTPAMGCDASKPRPASRSFWLT